MVTFETERLIIRTFKSEDWKDLYEYLSQKEVLQYEPEFEWTEESSKQEAFERSKDDYFLAVCLKETGKLIGHLCFGQNEPSEFLTWEIGYIFNPSYQGKGYATEACQRILQYGFEQLSAHRITAKCNLGNVASWRLLERLSMRREAHLKKCISFRKTKEGEPIWWDEYQYGILADEWRNIYMIKTIPEMGETKNLIIKNSTIEECNELQKISESWEDKKEVDGEEFAVNYFYKCLTEGDLPPLPNAHKDYYRLKSIYLKDSEKLIGFFDLYFGFPTIKTVWISIFVLDQEYRKNGYGQEIIEFISAEVRKTEFMKIGIGVHLKNWPALRFWTKAGFDKILGIYGDEKFSETTFALMGLEKSL